MRASILFARAQAVVTSAGRPGMRRSRCREKISVMASVVGSAWVQLAELQFGLMAMGLFGGLAVFLFGMELMTGALKAVAGDGMRRLLARLTTNRFKAVLAGGVTTAIIQSSSVTTVLTVGFVSAGLMSLQQSIGIIMGAEIGTTVTAQIIAFKITHYALAIVALGFALRFFAKKEVIRQWGSMLLGFGLVFFGMNIMKEAMHGLRDYQPFLDLMKGMDNPLAAVATGALFTALVQSSSATTGVVIALGATGLISLEGAIALVLGANIGTCVTALLASIGNPRVAVQTALVHVTFNVLGVVLWFFFIPMLAVFVRSLGGDTARQIANAHTTFNIANTLIFIGFTGLFARFVLWVLPPRHEVEVGPIRPKYLDDNLISTPALALDRVFLELSRMGKRALHMVRHAPAAIISGSEQEVRAVARMDDDVDGLYDAIVTYLGDVSHEKLSEEQTRRVQDALYIANYTENMADVIETNMVTAGLHRTAMGVEISAETKALLLDLTGKVEAEVELAFDCVEPWNPEMARQVIAHKPGVAKAATSLSRHLVGRLSAARPARREAYSVESELVESLKRVYYLAKRIAKVVAAEDEAPASPEAAKTKDKKKKDKKREKKKKGEKRKKQERGG